MIKESYKWRSILVIIICFSAALNLIAQDTLKPGGNIIPLTVITGEITSVNSQLSNLNLSVLSAVERAELSAETDTLLFSQHLLREDSRIDNINKLGLNSLKILESDWMLLKSRLDTKQKDYMARLEDMEKAKSTLLSLDIVWRATYSSAKSQDASEVLLRQVEATLVRIDSIEEMFESSSEFLQTKLVRISNAIISCNDTLERINIELEKATREILEINQVPLWKIFSKDPGESPFEARRSMSEDLKTDLLDFTSNNRVGMLIHFAIFIILLFALRYLYSDLKSSLRPDSSKENEIVRRIIQRPLTSALLVTFLFTYALYGSLPAIISVINLLFLLVPVLIILNDTLPKKSRHYIYLPAGATLLVQFHSYIYHDSAFSRIFLLIIITISLASIYYIVSKRTFRSITDTRTFGRILYLLSLGTIALFAISLIGSVIGAVTLAEFLSYSLIRSVTLMLISYAIIITINSIIYTAIYGKYLQKLNLIAQYHKDIYRSISRIIVTLVWVFWAVITLKLFNAWDGVNGFLTGVWKNTFNVGSLPLSLGSIVMFFVIIWLTLFLSRKIKIIIEGEIAPRVKMKRGVPGALSLMLRISIISIGFLIAVAAAGFGLDKLAILLGALGVGIGFGLQNIFNNLVSGIILAFERPIQEGDIIEVGEFWGTVKEIGIRSSTIFTFEGAEVIVPNGNLISNELINWTLTDRNRRVEVTVGVKYGTDPDLVLNILRKVAEEHPDVLQEPAALPLFSGFGDSSLDFRMLFWIAKADMRFSIQSDVNVKINKALKEAGIEIPFPQVDLHVKSVDERAKFKTS